MRAVQLILREDVPSLGDAGDLVRVKVGYARNYLLPKGMAVLATESRITRESMPEATAKPMRAGKLALISPVTTSVLGRWVL